MKKIRFIFFLIISSNGLFAQTKDFGVWTNLSLEKNLSTRLNFTLTESVRFDENASQLSQHLTSLSGSYKITKKLSFSTTLRYAQKFKYDESINLKSRFQIGFLYKIKIKNLGINLEERFQSQLTNVKRAENWEIPSNYFRSRITIKYDLKKKIEPFFSTELFYNVGINFDNLRSRLGIEYEIDKFQSFKVFYMIDKEFNVKNPSTNYILGLGYKFSL